MERITFIGSVDSSYARKLGSKDKKKRKVINNGPSADGQAPLNEVGQQRTGYKYYRKRRALGFIGAGSAMGAGLGASLGGALGKSKKAMAVGALGGGVLAGGSSLVEHMSNKHSPFYQKNLFKKKRK